MIRVNLFDITDADEPAWKRQRWGEAIAKERSRERVVWPEHEWSRQPHVYHRTGDAFDDVTRPLHPTLETRLRQNGNVSTAAAREMIHIMQQRRRVAEKCTAHRARWWVTALGAFAVLAVPAAVLTPNAMFAAAMWPVISLATGTALGIGIRGRL